MDRLSKKVIDAMSDTRFPVVSFVHDLHREPLDTQEIFVYMFLRYAGFMADNYREGRLHPDFLTLGEWCDSLVASMDEHVT